MSISSISTGGYLATHESVKFGNISHSIAKDLPHQVKIAVAQSKDGVAIQHKAASSENVVKKAASSVSENMPKNLVWVTSERIPIITGGLGRVSQSIPWAMARHLGMDARVIVPYLKPINTEDQLLKRTGKGRQAFKPSGLIIKFNIPEHGAKSVEKFEVLQRFESLPEDRHLPQDKQRGNWIYALKNPMWADANDLYTYTANAKKANPTGKQPLINLDPQFAKNMVFSRAANHLLPLLDEGTSSSRGNDMLKAFKGKTDIVVVNDWMTGPVFSELNANIQAKKSGYNPAKLFFTHNHFSQDRPLSYAKRLGLNIPTEPSLIRSVSPTDDAKTMAHTEGQYSPLALGIHNATSVIINKPYAVTLTATPMAKGFLFQEALKQKVVNNLHFDMHHAVAPNFDPKTSEALKGQGFTQWDPKEDPTMSKFKQTNKVALQTALNMKKDPNAILMAWVARIDPRQKGFDMVLNSMETYLRKHPHLQFVIWGSANDSMKPAIEALKKKVARDPELKGRLYFPNQFATDPKRLTQTYAASDSVKLLSMWEPYGLTQLEAMVNGCVPTVHAVDGNRSTVSDPSMNGKHWIPQLNNSKTPETPWKYGQTGVMMEPISPVNFLRSLDRMNEIKATELLLQNVDSKAVGSPEMKARDAGLTVGSLRSVGDIAKNALNDIADKPKHPDGFERPVLNDSQIRQLQDIKSRYLPSPNHSLSNEQIEKQERRPLNAKEQAALKSDLNTLRLIFGKSDTDFQNKTMGKFQKALDRTIELAKDADKMAAARRNANRYVTNEHSESAILKRFYEPALKGTMEVHKEVS